MRKIPKKNYLISVIMLVGVVIITFSCRDFYNNNLKSTSVLYKYVRHMSKDDLKEYLFESPSLIIYVADKYELKYEKMEEKLKKKIVGNDLYNNFIYIDYKEFNDEFLDYFNSKYHAGLDLNSLPTIIIYEDGNISNIYNNLDEDNINAINLEGVK